MATAQAVLYAGGLPLFAECGPDLTLSPDDLADLLARHDDIAAVIGTHVYGLPCRTGEIQELVTAYSQKKSRPIPLLYDAAHAFGSGVDGTRVGNFGDAEIFSLSATKALVSVEGGLVASRDLIFTERIKQMRNYGIRSDYNAGLAGMNGKMSEFHAIIGLHNLRRLDYLLETRQRKARYFYERLKSLTEIETLPWPENIVHTFKDLTILLRSGREAYRDDLMAFLKTRGIDSRAYFFPPVHEQEYFKPYADRPLPTTEALSRRVITLPFFASIAEAEIDYIVGNLQDFFSNTKAQRVSAD
jgi:dTDP-4-amino-4,6-dideoxygalactose transaminase